MVFQPVVNGADSHFLYAEALLRWRDPSLGQVGPDAFIPIAEARGLLPEIGTHVLAECCDVLASRPDLTLSVNISPLQLIDQQFADRVLDITQAAGVAPERLILELTENALIDVPETARARIDTLRSHGFRFALDDFGTGYASVSYLKHFPFEILKIDRSYLAQIGTSARARALFETFVNLGQTLGMDTVAEGIETAEQAETARDAGCTMHQGFYHSYPLSLKDLDSFIARPGKTGPEARQHRAG